MRPMVMPLGPFAVRFWPRFGFFDHHKAGSGRSNSAFGPAGRFSTRFGRGSWCAKLLQKARHRPPYLLRGGRTLSALPRAQHRQAAVLAEQQLIAGTGHQPTPAFHLLRGAQVGLLPEQVLLEKAIAMLLREALAIPGPHLRQWQLRLASPDEPTFAWVTLGATGGLPLHPDHGDLGLRGLLEMQPFPTGDHHALAVLIDALPLRRGLPMGLGARSLKERAVFARGTAFAGARRGRTIQFAVALEPDQRGTAQLATGLHYTHRRIPAIRQDDDRALDEGQHRTQLGDPDLDGGLLRANAALIQDAHPTTRILWQEHQRGKLPAYTHRFGRIWQIRHVDHAPVPTASGFQVLHAATIQPDPDRFIGYFAFQQGLHEDLSQTLHIDASILQRFIHAGPAPLEKHRQRQFRQTARLWLAKQRVAQIEQRIATALKAVIHLLTNSFQCVKVHLSNAPLVGFTGILLSWATLCKKA